MTKRGWMKGIPGYPLLDEMVREIVKETGIEESRELAELLMTRLVELDESGETWVAAARQEVEMEGWRLLVCGLLKSDEGICRIAATGEVLSTPTRYGIPVKRASGRVYYQQRLWWEMSWSEVRALVLSLLQQVKIMGNRVTALREVLQLHERFPQTKTPGEACELAGIDPRDFGLGEAME